MDDKRDNNPKDGVQLWVPVIAAAVGAVLGSVSGVGVYLGTPLGQEVARPDPFTGSEARQLDRRIKLIEDAQSNHFTTHPDQAGRFDARIAALEAQNSVIIQNQQRILNRLDDL